MKTATPQQKEQSAQRRAAFIATCKDAKKAGAQTIESAGGMNALLVAMYRGQTGREDFRSFKEWREAGYIVQKGAQGFPIWSRPIAAIKAEQDKPTTEEDFSRYGVCYLFHDGQVKPAER